MARADYKKPDYYARKAKAEGYAARSVFKLEEVDATEGLFRAGMRVLDLGAAPGSWMQYASERVGAKGRVVGVDLKPLSRPERANERFLAADAFALDPAVLREIAPAYDLVLSDMMPSTIGHKESDHYRSVALAERALALADLLLRPGGNFLVKVFQGPDFNAYRDTLRQRFAKVKIKKPDSSRQTSREIYLLGLGKKVLGGEGKNGTTDEPG
jgi:23S rRNA (uridine2552-2'-O)-methyltransferase